MCIAPVRCALRFSSSPIFHCQSPPRRFSVHVTIHTKQYRAPLAFGLHCKDDFQLGYGPQQMIIEDLGGTMQQCHACSRIVPLHKRDTEVMLPWLHERPAALA